MNYRKLGKTNEDVSILGFGCMRFPVLDGDPTKIDEAQSKAMVRYAIDNGLNYVDTAYPYHGNGSESGGMSEPFTAKVLRDGYREKVKLATKLPSWLIKKREDMDRYLNRQLERLETDYIDFYLVHALNQEYWDNLKQQGLFEFLDSIRKDGRVRHVGFSFHDRLELFKEIVDAYDWEFCQIQYNYIDENYQAGKEGLEYAAERGLGIVIMEPLRGGNLASSIPDEVQEAFDGAPVKRTPAAWALHWVWNNPAVGTVLSGMSDMDQVAENMRLAADPSAGALSGEEAAIMETVKQRFRERIKVDCTGCEYCLPCPFGVAIPDNFAIYNGWHLFDSEEVKARKLKEYEELGQDRQAANCRACGVCVSKCPQHIPIPERMKDVAGELVV